MNHALHLNTQGMDFMLNGHTLEIFKQFVLTK